MKNLEEIISLIEDKGYITPLDNDRLNSRVQAKILIKDLEIKFGKKFCENFSIRGEYKPDEVVDIYIIIDTMQINEKEVEDIFKETRKKLLKDFEEYKN